MKILVSMLAGLLLVAGSGPVWARIAPSPTPTSTGSATPTPSPTPAPSESCVPSAPITEYYLQCDDSGANCTGTSQVLTTLTKPVVTDGIYADYNGADPPCAGGLMNNGSYNCKNWEIPTMTIVGPNGIGPIDDAHVNATVQMASLWGTQGYETNVIPSVNPQPLTYVSAVSPEWHTLSVTSDGTCVKTIVENAGQRIGDVIETGGVYSLAPSLCEPKDEACQDAGRTTVEHWVVEVMDSTGVQSLPDVSAEVSLDSRGSCAVMGEPFNSVSGIAGNTTCPGTE